MNDMIIADDLEIEIAPSVGQPVVIIPIIYFLGRLIIAAL
jgi:hypothetical protein